MIYQQQLNGKIITSKHDKVDQNSCFQLRNQVLGSFLFAETPVCSVLMFVLELRRARSGCIVQQAASVRRFAPDECGQASRNRNLRHPAVDRFDRTVAKAAGRIRNKVTSAVFRAGSN